LYLQLLEKVRVVKEQSLSFEYFNKNFTNALDSLIEQVKLYFLGAYLGYNRKQIGIYNLSIIGEISGHC